MCLPASLSLTALFPFSLSFIILALSTITLVIMCMKCTRDVDGNAIREFESWQLLVVVFASVGSVRPLLQDSVCDELKTSIRHRISDASLTRDAFEKSSRHHAGELATKLFQRLDRERVAVKLWSDIIGKPPEHTWYSLTRLMSHCLDETEGLMRISYEDIEASPAGSSLPKASNPSRSATNTTTFGTLTMRADEGSMQGLGQLRPSPESPRLQSTGQNQHQRNNSIQSNCPASSFPLSSLSPMTAPAPGLSLPDLSAVNNMRRRRRMKEMRRTRSRMEQRYRGTVFSDQPSQPLSPSIKLPQQYVEWCAGRLGTQPKLDQLRRWYRHGNMVREKILLDMKNLYNIGSADIGSADSDFAAKI